MENDKQGQYAKAGQELYEHFQFTADPGQEPLRVINF